MKETRTEESRTEESRPDIHVLKDMSHLSGASLRKGYRVAREFKTVDFFFHFQAAVNHG